MASGSTGQFFLAYGLNLSSDFMKQQLCQDSFHIGMLKDPNLLFPWTPLAIAYLEGYEWIISERGEANLVPVSSAKPSDNGHSQRRGPQYPSHKGVGDESSDRRTGDNSAAQSSSRSSSLQESIISRMAVSSLTNVEPPEDTHGTAAANGRLDGPTSSSPPPAIGNTLSSRTDVVYGILYYLPPSFECVMDTFQGFALGDRPLPPETHSAAVHSHLSHWHGRRKLIEKVHIYHCLVSPNDMNRLLKRSGSATAALAAFPGSNTADSEAPTSGSSFSSPPADRRNQRIDAVVYIDDINVGKNCDSNEKRPPLSEAYAREFNKGLAAAVKCGLPKQWVDTVVRRWVPDVL